VLQRIGGIPGVPRGPNFGERSLDALISGTLYVFLDLGYFSSTEIEFETALIKRICEEAVSGLPNSSTLLDEVCKSFDELEVWIEKLLQLTNKHYLFLFIDEISDLTSYKFRRFVALYSEDKRKPLSSVRFSGFFLESLSTVVSFVLLLEEQSQY